MKNVIAILAFMMIGQAQAQTGTVVVPAPEQATTQQGSPIYILNNQKFQGSQGAQQGQLQAQVQEQPTTVIQESPLKTSAADAMRRKRQDVEASTEDGIVQALEQARLQDEARRRDRFNQALNHEPQAPVVQQPVHQPAPPVVQVVPAPVQTPPPVTKVEIEVRHEKNKEKEERHEDLEDLRASRREVKPVEVEAKSEYYIAGMVGMGKYPDIVNLRGNLASGFAVGLVTAERIVMEGSFMYSTYELGNLGAFGTPYYNYGIDLKQYNLSAALKYQFLPGKLRPSVGALASYVRRTYAQDSRDYGNTDAIDVGAVVGLDLMLTSSFSIGGDFRYYTNLAYRDSKNRSLFTYPEFEKVDYYVGMLVGKFTF